MFRRLDPDKDRECFADAWLWESSAPSWFKQADRVFGPPTFENFIEGSKEETRATFGIFETGLIGLIILTLRGNGTIEADLMAKPGCSREEILRHAIWLKDRIFEELNVQEIVVWLPRRNLPTRRLCAIIGFRETGIILIRGTYRGRVIEWLNLSIPRAEWESENRLAA